MIKIFAPKFWYQRNFFSYLLLPLSFFYRLLVRIRRFYYQYRQRYKFSVPIVIVGNLTVGGSGKTPLVVYLAKLLKDHGYQPGIVSRGYGRKSGGDGIMVTSESQVIEVGDEPLLIARKSKCPVVVAADRVTATKKLLATYKCDLVISDDGLQHYPLSRDFEIVLIDGETKFGNGFCLPAGPLREAIARLNQVDFIIYNRSSNRFSELSSNDEYQMFLEVTAIRNLKNPLIIKEATDFKEQTIHAVAGIARPEKFFQTLRQLGLNIIEHPFPDHYLFCEIDFPFADEIVIMTEKDAVKCEMIANQNFWYLEIKVRLSRGFSASLLGSLDKYRRKNQAG